MIEKNQRHLKKSATSVTKVFYICSMVVHCETNCNGLFNGRKKFRVALKKSATSITKVFYMQYGASL